MKRLTACVLAAFVLSTSAAFAQTIEATPAPKPPKPNFASVKFMLGTWSCSTKSARRPSPYLWTMSYALDPTGYWLIGTSKFKGTPWFPYPGVGEDKITYDADTSRWIDSYTDTLGNYGLSASKGWIAGTSVWHDLSFAGGKDVTSQSDWTYTKVSASKVTGKQSFGTAKGKKVAVTQICTKTMAMAM